VVEEGRSDHTLFRSEEWVEMIFGEWDDRGADEGRAMLEILR